MESVFERVEAILGRLVERGSLTADEAQRLGPLFTVVASELLIEALSPVALEAAEDGPEFEPRCGPFAPAADGGWSFGRPPIASPSK